MLMISKNKSPIQLLKSQYTLNVLKPFYNQKSFHYYTKCVSIQSELGMVAAKSKLPTDGRNFRKIG